LVVEGVDSAAATACRKRPEAEKSSAPVKAFAPHELHPVPEAQEMSARPAHAGS